MNRTKIVASLVACTAFFSGPAFANGSLAGRVGLTGGRYSVSDSCSGSSCSLYGFTSTDEGVSVYGFLLGGRLSVKRFFFDLGLEGLKFGKSQALFGNEDWYRTDTTPTIGLYLGDRWNIFAGYRYSQEGDALFSGKTKAGNGDTQSGPFGGVGAQFAVAESVSLSPSLAYNKLKYKPEGGAVLNDFPVKGISFRLGVNFTGTPHAVFLKWQRIQGEYTGDPTYRYKYNENYVTVGYQASFAKPW